MATTVVFTIESTAKEKLHSCHSPRRHIPHLYRFISRWGEDEVSIGREEYTRYAHVGRAGH